MLTANDINSNINVIGNSLVIQHFNITVPDTATSVPSTGGIPSFLTDQNGRMCSDRLGQSPLLLHSIAIQASSSFLSSYSILVQLNGLNIDNNNFNLLPSSSSGFDYVPTGKSYKIPAGSRLDVYAYNSTEATTAGVFSYLAIFSKLDDMPAEEQAML